MKHFISLASASCLSLALSLTAQAQVDSSIPAYQPQPVKLTKGAPYVMRDGSVYIVGNDGMEEMLKKFNDLFMKTHSGFKFSMVLKGSSTGIGGLTAGVSAFAPMGREAWPTDVTGFRETFGYLPFDIHVGYDGFGPRPKLKTPPAIYVNAKNPLPGLTVEQLTRIFASGAPEGDITHWSELGLKGEWAKRVIHVYGPRDDGGLATSLRYYKMNKLPFSLRYEALPHGTDLIHAVADDPYGIALVGFADADTMSKGVKLVPLAEKDGEPFSDASYENVTAGRYPLVPQIHFYVNREPGKPMDPFVKEYLRLVLSREGQTIIAAEKDTEEGYVPLSANEVNGELAKLQ